MIAKWYKGERNTKDYIKQWKIEIEQLKEKLRIGRPDLSLKDDCKYKNLILFKIKRIESLIDFYKKLNRIDEEI